MNKVKKQLFALLILAAACLGPSPLAAQSKVLDILKGETQSDAPPPKVDWTAELPRKKEQNLKTLSDERKVLEEIEGPTGIDSGTPYARRVELREELNQFYEQILESWQYRSDLEASERQIAEGREAWQVKKNGEVKPSFFQLDDLVSERHLELNRIATLDRNLGSSQAFLEEAKGLFEKRESERRQAKEQYELNKDPARAEELKIGLEIAELQSQVQEARILLIQSVQKNLRFEKQTSEARRDLLSQKIEWYQQNVQFSDADLQEKLRQIDEEQKKLNRGLESLRAQLENLKKEEAVPEPSTPAVPALTESEEKVRKLARLNLQIAIQIQLNRLQRLRELKELWRERFQIFNKKATPSQIKVWGERAQRVVDQIQRNESQVYIQLSEQRKNLNYIQERIQNLEEGGGEARQNLFAEKDLTQKIILNLQESLAYLSRDRQIFEKFLHEIEPQIAARTFGQRMGVVWEKLQYVWNFELTSIDDQPITVKKLVLALILLLFGVKFSRRMSQLLGRKIFPKLGIEAGAAAGLQTLAFYLLLLLVTILVLYIVNVPLTLFTVLGGALAIGVGFGSQNIVKNFISGLILLMERPIRIGDMVEMDNLGGVVERIGARSTLLRTFNNVHILIPNSDFLEKRVVNWTLSDDLARISLKVGVQYNSDLDAVSRLMVRSAAEHPQVLKTPEPIVLFVEFGDNALQFELVFWIRMASMMDRKRVESELRFRIEALFREGGIVIAFPQRDIHLDTQRPLEVKILEGRSPTEGKAGSGPGG